VPFPIPHTAAVVDFANVRARGKLRMENKRSIEPKRHPHGRRSTVFFCTNITFISYLKPTIKNQLSRGKGFFLFSRRGRGFYVHSVSTRRLLSLTAKLRQKNNVSSVVGVLQKK
jgi:hypothetical protein